MIAAPLADWWDDEIWRHTGHGEYREPVSPEELLRPAPDCIWPGLMSCDFLPLLSNTAGDWLCVRIDQQGRAEQIVQWYHGGGDWIPWGHSLAEAVLLDALIHRLPGPSRRHAEPAEDPRPTIDPAARDVIVDWACRHLSGAASEIMDANLDGPELADALLKAELAEVAVRCELVVDQLVHPQREQILSLGDNQAIDPKLLAQWSFDRDRIPADKRSWLHQQGIDLARQTNWDAAAEHAQRVTAVAPDLAWAWDIVGYAAERRDDFNVAIDAYVQASQCSVFTDQSIRLDTHWTSDHCAKFSVARLDYLDPGRTRESEYYRSLTGPDVRQRRIDACDYWLRQATQAQENGDAIQTHRCLMAAAWDVGVDSITGYAKLLDQIAEAAGSADQLAREELARTHRRCLRERFGL